jgi:2-hydroxycyclohexanecarboxyl-CoA dehydrogenase
MSRVAVVTGGGSGMGRAICHQLAGQGHRIGVLDIDGAAATSVAAEITGSGGTAAAGVVDVSERAAIETALEEVRSAFGPVEIMVTSAGIEGFTEFLDITTWRPRGASSPSPRRSPSTWRRTASR